MFIRMFRVAVFQRFDFYAFLFLLVFLMLGFYCEFFFFISIWYIYVDLFKVRVILFRCLFYIRLSYILFQIMFFKKEIKYFFLENGYQFFIFFCQLRRVLSTWFFDVGQRYSGISLCTGVIFLCGFRGRQRFEYQINVQVGYLGERISCLDVFVVRNFRSISYVF